jgi:hypothetical protein
MSTFEKREEGFERAFAQDEELRFKARARRNRKLGAWAAEQLGLSGDAANAFAASLAEQQLESPDDEILVGELLAALEKASPPLSEHRIRRHIEEFAAQALRELQAGR